jgi:hypothetical protein
MKCPRIGLAGWILRAGVWKVCKLERERKVREDAALYTVWMNGKLWTMPYSGYTMGDDWPIDTIHVLFHGSISELDLP